jgi:hypothetical protein
MPWILPQMACREHHGRAEIERLQKEKRRRRA